MSSIPKPDNCMDRPNLVLLSAYQEYLMTLKLMTSQVVQRKCPSITRICVIGAQRVNMRRTPSPCMLSHLSREDFTFIPHFTGDICVEISVSDHPLEVLALFLSLTVVSMEGSFLGIWFNSITH